MNWLGRLFQMPQKAAEFDRMIAAQVQAQQQACSPYWSWSLFFPEECRLDYIPSEMGRWADDGGPSHD